MGCVQRAQQFDDLGGRLAGAVDHLGVAGALEPVGVETCVSEVVDARLGTLVRQMCHAENLRGLGTMPRRVVQKHALSAVA